MTTPLTAPVSSVGVRRVPDLSATLALFKPVTWFPPMWAFSCGVVAAGVPFGPRWARLPFGIMLTGPLVCAASQAVNDWFDRHVDAINEPDRPIPSGRIPGRWGLGLAIGWSALSLAVSVPLGRWGVAATALALVLAWAYSMPPVRLKRNGWYGNLAVGLSYEGLAWITGTAVMLGVAAPPLRTIALALCYSLGAHGIMTINDFKSIDGDRRVGIGSLPARLGPDRAARLACAIMACFQVIVVALLVSWGRPGYAAAVAAIVALQLPLMARFIAAPRSRDIWFSATGVPLYVTGMMISAFALRSIR